MRACSKIESELRASERFIFGKLADKSIMLSHQHNPSLHARRLISLVDNADVRDYYFQGKRYLRLL